MAAGRNYYTLEALAHRDGYRIRDVDNLDGYLDGERRWRLEGCPQVLEGAWELGNVLQRWKEELAHDDSMAGPGVRLSPDAGRFLCDFIYYESLSVRWKEAAKGIVDANGESREGKACFFHVPGDTDPLSVETGARVAEAAIRSIVGSWEEGRRREGYGKSI